MPEIGPISYAEIGPMSVPRWPRSGRYWANIVWLSGYIYIHIYIQIIIPVEKYAVRVRHTQCLECINNVRIHKRFRYSCDWGGVGAFR